MNPLNAAGNVFDFGLMNPNPMFKKTKDGPVYYLKAEIDKEIFDMFVEANTKGMLIACKAMVTQDGQFIEPEAKEEPPKEKGPHGAFAFYLYKSGFFNVPELWEHFGLQEEIHAANRIEWIINEFKANFYITSLTDLHPEVLLVYCRFKKLDKCAHIIDAYIEKNVK